MKACTVQQLLQTAPRRSHLALHLCPGLRKSCYSSGKMKMNGFPPTFWHLKLHLLFDTSSKSEVLCETGSLPCAFCTWIAISYSQGHRSVFPNRQPNKKKTLSHRSRSLHGRSKKKQTMGGWFGWFVRKTYTICNVVLPIPRTTQSSSHSESFWSTCFASKNRKKKHT